MVDPVEAFWEEILSRQQERIQKAFAPLSPEEKITVLKHLKGMVSEPGWQPEQVVSASQALDALKEEG
jgi:methionine salvage enolase-phosphatase E1